MTALVCGFGDMAAGIGAMAWDLGDPGAVLLDGDEVKPASFAIEERDGGSTVEVTAGDTVLEATLAYDSSVQADALDIHPSKAEVLRKGDSATVDCVGHLVHLGDGLSEVATFRHVTIDLDNAAMLLAAALGRPGAAGHGEESAAGWRFDSGGGSEFEETLLSTQYDAAGDPTRLGMELWPQDADTSVRAAAVRVSGSLIGGARQGDTWAGFFRCHTDEQDGLGTYLLRRA